MHVIHPESRFLALCAWLNRRANSLLMAILACIAAALFLIKLGTGALLDWDEAIYAEVSREMLASHHWLTPIWQHQPFFEKPPLVFWVQAFFMHWFGVTEFAVRLASALAGIAIVLLTYSIARRMAGPAAGIFAGFVLLTCNHFDRIVREGTTDALLCLCIYLSVYAYVRLRAEGPAWFYLLCAAVGVGVMIKGPAILIAPFAIGIDWYFRRREKRLVDWRQGCLGLLLALAIAGPWHIWMLVQYGRDFLSSYVGHQLAARVTSVLEDSGGSPAFYLRIIGAGAFPWSIVVLIAATKWLWRKEWAYSLPWLLMAILLLYSFVPTKHPWYIIPIYPALAMEVGRLLAEVCKVRRVMLVVTVAVLTLGIVIGFVRLARRQGDPFTNQVEQLAMLARRSATMGRLFVLTTPTAQPPLYRPTAIFYSERDITLVSLPGDGHDLAAAIQQHASVDAIVQKEALRALSQRFAVHPLAQSSLLLYATVSRKP